MRHLQSAISLFTALALAVIAGACAQEGENRSALTAVTGPSAIVQNHGDPQGCSPGFWKNHPWPAGVSRTATLQSIFDVPDALGLDNVTLFAALNTGGGGVNALLRQGVAAYLNAAHLGSPPYPINTFWVAQAVNNALASGDYESIKDQLDVWNNTHAPGFCD
jgi:hypothetical protein